MYDNTVQQGKVITSGSIKKGNARAFHEVMCSIAEFGCDNDDWLAFKFGIKDTDVERGKYFTYHIVGRYTISLNMAIEREDNSLEIRIAGPLNFPDRLVAMVEMLINICQLYDVSDSTWAWHDYWVYQ